MEPTTLRRRLLLCLFGLGTNTGLKSMASEPGDDYKDLLTQHINPYGRFELDLDARLELGV
jgi:hypothetical protein